jgi:hypothetical protein
VNSTLRLLIIIAVALTGLIALELAMPSRGDSEITPAPAAQTAETNAPPQETQSPADYAATILARPLFRPDRHPYQTNDQEADSTAPVDLPRLTGILLASDLKRAIFAPEGSDKPIVVAEGENVGDWRVQEIAADSVTMSGPDGTRRLRPKFAPNAVATTPPVPDAVPVPEPQPAPAPGAGPVPQIPKRGTALLNARRHQHDNMRPPQPPARKH